ncbi:MAG: tryptophanase [Planctomycetes bacterium]|nr:tryptophanase [Planctomycetota bacterium]MCW8135995.1 tryptophanase [Planctomycetota bacterium]
MRPPRTIIEPFRIKTVEPLNFTTPQRRRDALREAQFNPFKLHARDITIDLLTDSGTGAMSAAQWAAMMTGDETYAGSESYYRLESVVRELTGVRHVIPTHQGRASEHILFSVLDVKGRCVLANSHFDTTRANVEYLGGEAVDLLTPQGADPRTDLPFKGDIDLVRLEELLEARCKQVAAVLMTVTNNAGGGQPVSLANLRQASAMARARGVPFVLDAARFAENAWFIHEREGDPRTPREIAREMFGLCDAFTFSAKKDGLVNIGGLLGLNDDTLADRARSLLILTEGFPTYGGLAGRDLDALAVGLQEVTDEHYLRYRIASVRYLFDLLDRGGVPLMRPAGGHAVYIDAAALYPHIPPVQLPGVALCNELYLEAGVRGVEIGTLMFGKRDACARHELVRLAFPRRVYTQSHVDWLGEVILEVASRRERAPGYRIVRQGPVLRAFTAELAPLT